LLLAETESAVDQLIRRVTSWQLSDDSAMSYLFGKKKKQAAPAITAG
jgi:hypothetical protein